MRRPLLSPTEFMPGDIVRTSYAQVGEVLTVGAALCACWSPQLRCTPTSRAKLEVIA